MKNKEIKNLKTGEKNGPEPPFIHTTKNDESSCGLLPIISHKPIITCFLRYEVHLQEEVL